MADNKDNLQFGINLTPDLSEFEKSWRAKEKEIQNIIDKHTFEVKIVANQDLDKLEAQLNRINKLQKESARKLTSYQAGKLDIAQRKAEAEMVNKAALAEQRLNTERERTAKTAIQKEKAALSLARAQERATKATLGQTQAYKAQEGTLSRLSGYISRYTLIFGAYRLVNNIKDITSEFELQRVSLRAITQDAEFADSLFNRIKAVAVESPFSVKEMITYTKQLAAYRVENEKLYDTMNMLADVSAGLGVDMNRLILAYGQVKAASVLRGQELRQFTEAGIPMVEQLAIKFSQLRNEVVSTGEVFDLISKRKVPFEMVAEIFEDMTKKGGKFYEMQKKQAESLYGVYANLKDNLQIAMDEIGRSSRGTLLTVGQALTYLAKHLQTIIDLVTTGAAGFLAYKTAMLFAANGAKGLAASEALVVLANQSLTASESAKSAAMSAAVFTLEEARAANDYYAIATARAALANNTLTRSFWKLMAAIAKNPLVIAITAITAAVAGGMVLWKRHINNLSSADEAQKEVAQSAEEGRRATQAAKDELEEYTNAIKEQDILVRSQKHTYDDFKKIYPELAKKYKTEEEYTKALNSAYEERKKAISNLKSVYGAYFGYLDEENFKVDQLKKGYLEYDKALRASERSKLEALKSEYEDKIVQLEKERIVTEQQMGSSAMAFGGGISPANWSEIIAKLEGYQNKLKAVEEQLEQLSNAEEVSAKASTHWRQMYHDNVDALGEQELAALSLTEAIDNTRKAYKNSSNEVENYRKTIETLKDSLKSASGESAAKIQEDIDDITKKLTDSEGAKSMLETFAKYMGFSLDSGTSGGSANSKAIKALKDQYSLVRDVYKRYKELRKSMSDDAAKQEIQNLYGSMFKKGIDFLDTEGLKKKLTEFQQRAKRLGDTSLAIQLGVAIQDIDLEEMKKNLSAKLNKMSREISQSKAGADLFESMLGLTGDTELSTQITLALTGVDITGQNIREQLAEQLASIVGDASIAPEVEASLKIKPQEGENAESYLTRIKNMLIEGKIAVADFNTLIDSIGDKDLKSNLESALKEFTEYDKKMLETFFSAVKKSEDFATREATLRRTYESESDPKRLKILDQLRPSDIDKSTWAQWVDDYLKAVRSKFDAGIAELKFDEFKKKFEEPLADMDSASIDVLDKIIKELQTFISMPGVDPTMLKSIMSIIEKATKIKIDKNPLKALINAKDINEAKQAVEKLKDNFQTVSSSINDVIGAAEDVADALGVSFGEETQDAIDGFKSGIQVTTSVISAMTAAMTIVQSSMWGLVVVALAVGAAFAAIKWLSGKQAREIDSAIEYHVKALEKLEQKYNDLKEAEAKALGKEWIANQSLQIKNLEAQIAEIDGKIAEERRRKKSDIDEESIADWESEKQDILRQIREIKAGITKEMTGTDLTSAAKEFAEAWLDAYLSFGDTTEAIQEKFQEMMRSMVVNSVLARVVQSKLKPLFDYIDENLYDESGNMVGSLDEVWRRMKDIGETLPGELEKMYESIGSWVGDLRTSESSLSGIAKGVAQASEESVVTLSGYANSILYYHVQEATDLAAIRAILEGKALVSTGVTPQADDNSLNVGQLLSLQQDLLNQVVLIKNDTSAIRDDIADIKASLGSVVSTAGSQSTRTINVKIR